MDTERDALIEQLAHSGKDKDDVRRELISQGLSTAGFEAVYASFVKDVPKETFKPKPIVIEGKILGDFESFDQRSVRKEASRSKSRLTYAAVASVFVVVGLLIFQHAAYLQGVAKGYFQQIFGESSVESFEKGININDKLIQGKVESTASSAHIFGKRMGSLDGVCRDIMALDPVICLQSGESAVVFGKMSDGTYYCVDTQGFRGNLENKPYSGAGCRGE